MAKLVAYKKPKNVRKTLKLLFRYLRRHLTAFLAVTVMVVISALANIYGTYLLKPVINQYIVPGNVPGLIRMLLFMGAIYLAGALCTLGYTQLMVKTAQQVVKEIRSDLFHKTQKLPVAYFDAKTHGELMSRFTNDMDTVQEGLNNSFTMIIQSFIITVGTLVMIVVLNARLSLIVFIAFICMFAFIRYSSKKSQQHFNEQQKYLGNLNGFIEEMVEGAKVVKVFNHEEKNMEEFRRRNEELRKASTSALTHGGRMVPVVVSISYLNYAVSACIGGLFAISGLMDLGSLSSYLVYVRQTAMPFTQFTQQMNFIMATISGAERIFEVMEESEELDRGEITLAQVRTQPDGSLTEYRISSDERVPVSDKDNILQDREEEQWAWKCPQPDGSFVLRPMHGDVRFHDVTFEYVKGQPILHDIDLYAKPGQKIAFVGSTGAGKTTITNLINRFYEIANGSITYDGIDIKKIRKNDLRHSLSQVLQDTHLFTGSIEDNIRYGKLDASYEEVVAAAKLANADSFIRRLPNGYQTMLHSDGANLSQGQRQLLSIARAAIADPLVLILDEATSSVDTRTEKLIEKGMDRLMRGRTVFVIAHRLSTVRNADAIMVLENGRIIERGDHDDLLRQKGRYYQLYHGMFELS